MAEVGIGMLNFIKRNMHGTVPQGQVSRGGLASILFQGLFYGLELTEYAASIPSATRAPCGNT